MRETKGRLTLKLIILYYTNLVLISDILCKDSRHLFQINRICTQIVTSASVIYIFVSFLCYIKINIMIIINIISILYILHKICIITIYTLI